MSGVTTYGYDLAGNQTSITDPDSNVTTYAYDSANEQTSVTNPMGYTVTYDYNSAGELTETTDADGRSITYSYDSVGRQTGETWVSGSYTATWTYDAAGRLTKAQDTYSSYSYGYDSANRLTGVDNTGTPGGMPHVILTYSYDDYNNRTGLTDNMNGTVSFGYDDDQRITSIAMKTGPSHTLDAQVTMAYDGAGNVTGITRSVGDNIATTLSYDSDNRLTNMTTKDTSASVTLSNYTYGNNTASEVTSYQDNSSTSLTYSYDNEGELTGASGTMLGSSYSVSYSYDANGNRNMTGYSTGTGNELLSDGTYSYTYDHNGNLTSQTDISTGYVTYYSWDYENRLTEVKAEDNHANVLNDEKFTYDVNGNRIGVSLNGTQQLYTVYDGSNPYMDFNGSGTLTERYLTYPQGLNQFYGEVNASGTTQWLLTDELGSIRQVVSTSGSVLDAITYDPYGSIVSQTNSSNAPRFMYTGGTYDSITGTYLDGVREYNPEDGRWLSQDPLGFESGDSNLYRYASDSPLDQLDPSGLKAKVTSIAVTNNGQVDGKPFGPNTGPRTLSYGFSVKVSADLTGSSTMDDVDINQYIFLLSSQVNEKTRKDYLWDKNHKGYVDEKTAKAAYKEWMKPLGEFDDFAFDEGGNKSFGSKGKYPYLRHGANWTEYADWPGWNGTLPARLWHYSNLCVGIEITAKGSDDNKALVAKFCIFIDADSSGMANATWNLWKDDTRTWPPLPHTWGGGKGGA